MEAGSNRVLPVSLFHGPHASRMYLWDKSDRSLVELSETSLTRENLETQQWDASKLEACKNEKEVHCKLVQRHNMHATKHM